jgi:hypothetical protein
MCRHASLLEVSYNSSIFGAYAAQDYEVTFTSYNSTSENLTWKTFENKDWSRMYATSWVPGYSDLQLIIDQFSFEVQVLQNWSYSLQSPLGSECSWPAVWIHNESFTMDVSHFRDNNTLQPKSSQKSRFVVDSFELQNNSTAFPEVKWPVPHPIKANDSITLDTYLKVCPDGGWLTPATAFHVQYARAKVNPYANRVQVAIPFFTIVIFSNIVKIVGIYFAIRMQSSEHLITVGDAISSFLEHPESRTEGKCTLNIPQLRSHSDQGAIKPWRIVRKPILIVLGGARVWSTTIV